MAGLIQDFRVKRKDKLNHLREKCPLQPTECPYTHRGVARVVTRGVSKLKYSGIRTRCNTNTRLLLIFKGVSEQRDHYH